MSNLVVPALRAALDALADRQRVIATNVANIHTPGYLAQRVDFETALADAIEGPRPASEATVAGVATMRSSTDPARADGNNVSLEDETLLGLQTNLHYQMMARAVTGRMDAIRDVIRTA